MREFILSEKIQTFTASFLAAYLQRRLGTCYITHEPKVRPKTYSPHIIYMDEFHLSGRLVRKSRNFSSTYKYINSNGMCKEDSVSSQEEVRMSLCAVKA